MTFSLDCPQKAATMWISMCLSKNHGVLFNSILEYRHHGHFMRTALMRKPLKTPQLGTLEMRTLEMRTTELDPLERGTLEMRTLELETL